MDSTKEEEDLNNNIDEISDGENEEEELDEAIAAALQKIEVPSIPRRVKVYEMEDENWVDCGTGYCDGKIEGPLAYFIVRSEADNETILLKTQLIAEDIYSRQEETLIVWQELNGTDLALSFQESSGCIDMWMFLANVQKAISSVTRSYSNDDILTDEGALNENYLNTVDLPAPELANLKEIEEAVYGYMQSIQSRDSLVRYVSNENYIDRLIELFPLCEDLENTDDLHRLCSIIKSFVQLNDAPLLESLFSNDEKLMCVAGILEYDPEFPNIKANHREYLMDSKKFKQVVPIQDPRILAKIHQTFKLQYLRDVVVSRIVDEPSFSVLNSFIFFNQADIIQYLQTNEKFLHELFSIYVNEGEDDQRKQDGIFFIQQVCNIAKGLQFQSCSALFATFVKFNLLKALDYAMSHENNSVRNAGSDILVSIIDHEPAIVWQKFDQDRKDASSSLSNAHVSQHSLLSNLINILHKESNPGVLAQISEAFKMLLSLPGSYAYNNPYRNADGNVRNKTDNIIGINFIENFYDNSFNMLAAPLLELENVSSLDVKKLDMYMHLCELFCYFFRIHDYWSRRFDTYKTLTSKVALLLYSDRKYVVLSALRFIRSCLAARQSEMSLIMLETDTYGKVLDLMLKVKDQTNLVNSAALEFFEFLRSEGSEDTLDYLNKNYRPQLESLNNLSTFSELLNIIDGLSSDSRSPKTVGTHESNSYEFDGASNNNQRVGDDVSKDWEIQQDFSIENDTELSEKVGQRTVLDSIAPAELNIEDSCEQPKQPILEDRYFLESAVYDTSAESSGINVSNTRYSKRKSDFQVDDQQADDESPKKRLSIDSSSAQNGYAS
ncbi:serine/threonine protein phosphatase PP4 regulatory subunit 3 Psy2 [Schizosaccharomyces pombe]|uniref:Uncharacterized protein C216.01c n=1 Tax=Schizosaccharomyces pombe (strain 972 / ATCC 24843) TaxID=284812 RepID=YGL1_SCHPO|nr:putative DNA damage response protein [Schizosaccharomyces pombe]Q9Y7J8.3 RecName: Full=Uncharacterized protein C216.01c [Schizosaccharomyces pombe 972h-]CAC22614.2 DNA damage response protein (predicted) [Schizosaccharomyces pombe]|eukprot:NP_001342980.1 putative DNA damage response protein [Schizosaccharomyces pombe]